MAGAQGLVCIFFLPSAERNAGLRVLLSFAHFRFHGFCAIFNGSLSTVVPTAARDPWTFPRPNPLSTGQWIAPASPGPAFQVLCPTEKVQHHPVLDFFWQGHKDLNPEPTVLETAALPIELYPYVNIKGGSRPYFLWWPSAIRTRDYPVMSRRL